MLRIDVVNGRRIAAIEPEIDDEIVTFRSLDQWAAKHFAEQNTAPAKIGAKFVRSKTGFWIPANSQ